VDCDPPDRDRGDDIRDVEMPWVEVRDQPGLDREQDDVRDFLVTSLRDAPRGPPADESTQGVSTWKLL
jgi:hypothetical protein